MSGPDPAQQVIGIVVLVRPGDGQDANLAYLQIALFAVALRRAWSLVQGKHLSPSPRDTSAGSHGSSHAGP